MRTAMRLLLKSAAAAKPMLSPKADSNDIARIELVNTTSKSSIKITSKEGTTIGQIVGDSLKNLVLKGIDY